MKNFTEVKGWKPSYSFGYLFTKIKTGSNLKLTDCQFAEIMLSYIAKKLNVKKNDCIKTLNRLYSDMNDK
ncbi:MAG: hypothetical protein CVU00_11630 [Bacteroidetes bacterium HGW-Bacteroidetes-17]|jgi:hypothetical protein|nr:MAG: hypothetical protein CVU00_11630 [Bacteroidetes bacterium HGW-Bacteroidetes-17]